MDGWPSSIQLNVYDFYEYFYAMLTVMASPTDFPPTPWLQGYPLRTPPLRPFITALTAAYTFMRSHYGIKLNESGVISKGYQSLSKDDDDSKSIGENTRFLKSQTNGDHRLEAQGQDWRSRCHVEFDGQVNHGRLSASPTEAKVSHPRRHYPQPRNPQPALELSRSL